MHTKTAYQIHELFRSGAVSAKEIATYFLGRIEKHDPELHAFLEVTRDSVLFRAEELDQARANGKQMGKLAGVPIALKDNLQKLGSNMTCGSKILQNYESTYDATVVEFLEREGALLIGKTNMDEFAMGGSGIHSAFGPTKNPWNPDCIPGGSSSGSAAAVAARLCPIALGSDTGGSIRQPASFSGITGFKPTYGRVSRYGIVAFGSSLDQIGPLAIDAKDVAYVMEVLAQSCARDSMSIASPPPPYLNEIEKPWQRRKIGVPWKFLNGLSGPSRSNFEEALAVFESLGAEIVDIDLGILKYGIAVYYILAAAEASANLARFDGVRYGHRSSKAQNIEEVYDLSRAEGFGSEVKNRILLGTFVIASKSQNAYYDKAQRVRNKILHTFSEAFSQCDLIVQPVTPGAAPRMDQIADPLEEYLQDLYTVGANLAGLPGISVPSGFNSDGMPMGVQIIGPQMGDSSVLHAAHHYQQKTGHIAIPPAFGGSDGK